MSLRRRRQILWVDNPWSIEVAPARLRYCFTLLRKTLEYDLEADLAAFLRGSLRGSFAGYHLCFRVSDSMHDLERAAE